MLLIFYLPYEIDQNRFSTPNIRPLKLSTAFEKNYDSIIIFGKQHQRIAQIWKLVRKGKLNEFMLYTESASVPLAFSNFFKNKGFSFLEYFIIMFLTYKASSSGIFIRDIHWLFDTIHKSESRLYKIIQKWIGYFELYFFAKTYNVILLPSIEMVDYMPNRYRDLNVHPSPPGIEIHSNNSKHPLKRKKLNILYVGGLGEIYDLSLLLEVAKKLENRIELIINTRKEELKRYPEIRDKIQNLNNVQIKHLSGVSLEHLYSQCDVCSLYLLEHDYHSFMSPFKLYEYLSFGKPIISSNNSLFGEIIQRNNFGWILPQNIELASEIIARITPEDIKEKKECIIQQQNKHTWESRANDILIHLERK